MRGEDVLSRPGEQQLSWFGRGGPGAEQFAWLRSWKKLPRAGVPEKAEISWAPLTVLGILSLF